MVKSYRPGGVGMLPAEAGTYLVHAYFDNNEVDLVRANVIGWQVGAERSMTPLVIDPRAVVDDSWHVVHPDGRVECVDGRCWDNIDRWLVAERRKWRATHAEEFGTNPARRTASGRGKIDDAGNDGTTDANSRRSYYDPGPEIMQRPAS